MRVALAQLPSVPGDVDANLQRVEDTVEACRADLVVFPELNLTGYVDAQHHRGLALDYQGGVLDRLRRASDRADCHLVVGAPRIAGDGTLRNTAWLVGPSGEVTTYDKVHLAQFGPFAEGLHYAPGVEPVVGSGPGGVPLGLSICYDHMFPEVTKLEALEGARVLVNISASASPAEPQIDNVLATRALEAQAYLVFVNLVGDQGPLHFWGGSRVLDPFGNVVLRAPMDTEAVPVARLSMDLVDEVREDKPVLRDSAFSPTLRRVGPLGTVPVPVGGETGEGSELTGPQRW